MGWIEEVASAFGAEPLSPQETDELLEVAREVAHAVERKATPLATFLLGMRVHATVASGGDRAAAIRAAVGELRGLLERP
ncbi:MAG: hypothetical protein KatS3mg013_1763 [Actinomycetota bacterium]|jgi:hypothetical protein|nr:MAG: hypothetical protein KatS3mg013_1763 [Actinomycetota bacterium]